MTSILRSGIVDMRPASNDAFRWGPVASYGFPDGKSSILTLDELLVRGWHYPLHLGGVACLAAVLAGVKPRFSSLSHGRYASTVCREIALAVAAEAENPEPSVIRHVHLPSVPVDAIWIKTASADRLRVLPRSADGMSDAETMDAVGFVETVRIASDQRRRGRHELL